MAPEWYAEANVPVDDEDDDGDEDEDERQEDEGMHLCIIMLQQHYMTSTYTTLTLPQSYTVSTIHKIVVLLVCRNG